MSNVSRKKSEFIGSNNFNYLYKTKKVDEFKTFLGIIFSGKENTNSIINTCCNHGSEISATSIFRPVENTTVNSSICLRLKN